MGKIDAKLIHNVNDNRFEKNIDGCIAYIEYINKENKLYLTHTIVPKELGGKGIGTTLVRETLEEIEKRNHRVVPICSFVVSYIERHPEWEKLL